MTDEQLNSSEPASEIEPILMYFGLIVMWVIIGLCVYQFIILAIDLDSLFRLVNDLSKYDMYPQDFLPISITGYLVIFQAITMLIVVGSFSLTLKIIKIK